jgi:hypothetical protein
MSTVGEDQTASESPRFCAECGAPSTGRFCANCGHGTLTTPPATPPAPPGKAARSDQSSAAPPRRSRGLLLAAGGALGVAAIAIAAAVLLTGSSSSGSSSAYRHELSGALAPVVSTETALASSLQSLSGSNTTAAKNATGQAQTALDTAHGAVSVLTIPAGSSQLSEQVGQSVTQLNGYLQAVTATLNSPTAQNASQLQTSATNTQSSLVPVAIVIPGAGQSVAGGSQAVGTWVSARAAAARRQAAIARHRAAATHKPKQGQAAAPGPTATVTSTATAAPSTPAPATGSGSAPCGGGLVAGPNTSCPFAENVQQAWDDAPGEVATVTAYSPVTNQTYTMSCAPAGSGITCSGANNASVSFP